MMVTTIPMLNQKTSDLKSLGQGRYIYCVAKSNEQTSFGGIGIEGNNVYAISSNGLSAIVHDCKAQPYDSKDAGKVEEWVRTHQNVIEKAQEKFGTVIPSSFDVIIKGENAGKEVADWLEAEKERLERNLEKVKGKQEFGVQIIYDFTIIGKELREEKQEIKKLVEKMEITSKGKAYFVKQKIKKALQEEIEKLAGQKFREFYSAIRKHCSDAKVDKNKRIGEGKEILLNLSCLVEKNMAKELGKELDKINKLNGFSVRFTGPWPPYSFVD